MVLLESPCDGGSWFRRISVLGHHVRHSLVGVAGNPPRDQVIRRSEQPRSAIVGDGLKNQVPFLVTVRHGTFAVVPWGTFLPADGRLVSTPELSLGEIDGRSAKNINGPQVTDKDARSTSLRNTSVVQCCFRGPTR